MFNKLKKIFFVISSLCFITVEPSFATVSIPSEEEVIFTFGNGVLPSLSPRRIKFLIWNLHKGMDKNFKLEYTKLALGRDIIMNQEIYLDESMASFFNYFPFFSFTTATSFFWGKDKIRTGVANISTVLPSSTAFLKTQTLEPVTQSPKMLLVTRYPLFSLTGKRLQLTAVNIHGINFVTNKAFAHEMDRIYEHVKNYPPPLVFAGDFNTWNKERQLILDKIISKLNLKEARFFPDNRTSFNGNPLDHFYYSSDLKIRSAKSELFYQGSDHQPLLVDIELN